MKAILKSTAAAILLASCSTQAAELLNKDFESDTVGANPAGSYVRPTIPTTNAFCTVVNSSVNTAGTGNGVELYDNDASDAARLAFDFSSGESAIRFDISLARLLADPAANGKVYSICVLANGGNVYSSASRYAEVRVYDNGNIRYYDDGGYGGQKDGYLTTNTPAMLSMYLNDSDVAIYGYETGYDLAANSMDVWLDGTYWGTGALRSSLSATTSNNLGRVGINSGTGDVMLDYVFDDIVVSTLVEAPPPPGTYIVDKALPGDSNTAGTNVVTTFDALAGDVIVVVSASGNADAPDTNSVVIGGGTAVIDPVVAGKAMPSGGPQNIYWYTTVTADGTVSVEQRHDGSTYWNMGAYQLRSGDGYSATQLLGSPLGERLSGAGSITNSYTLGASYSGVYLEAISAYGDGYWTPENSGTVVSAGYHNKRDVAYGSFSDLATLDNIWSSTNINKVTLLGLAFGSSSELTSNTEKYNLWLAGYTVGSDTNLLDDADNDQLDNLTEYAWGGEPDNSANQGNTPVQSLVNDGGTNYIEYVYYERSDATSRGLVSLMELGTDLVITNWADASSYEVGRGVSAIPNYTAVSNRIPTNVEDKQFISLKVELTP